MANCTYTFIDPLNGNKLVTLPNIHALKAYLFNGGAEALLGDKAMELMGMKTTTTTPIANVLRSKPMDGDINAKVNEVADFDKKASDYSNRVLDNNHLNQYAPLIENHTLDNIIKNYIGTDSFDEKITDFENRAKSYDAGYLFADKIDTARNEHIAARLTIIKDRLKYFFDGIGINATKIDLKNAGITEKEYNSKVVEWNNISGTEKLRLIGKQPNEMSFDEYFKFTKNNDFVTPDGKEIPRSKNIGYSASYKKKHGLTPFGYEEVYVKQAYKELHKNDAKQQLVAQAFKSLHTAISNGTATDVLDYLASQAKDKSIQSTAEQLKSKIPADIKINVLDSHPKGYGMSYNHKNNELNIYLDAWKGNANSAAYERGLTHEFIHAATSYQIDKNSEAKAVLNSLISDLKAHAKNNKLDSALTELINHATVNTHELLAYGLTEPSLQQLMQDIKASGDKTLWDKFVRTIADLLGIELDKEQESALSALLMVGDKLLGDDSKQVILSDEEDEIRKKAISYLPKVYGKNKLTGVEYENAKQEYDDLSKKLDKIVAKKQDDYRKSSLEYSRKQNELEAKNPKSGYDKLKEVVDGIIDIWNAMGAFYAINRLNSDIGFTSEEKTSALLSRYPENQREAIANTIKKYAPNIDVDKLLGESVAKTNEPISMEKVFSRAKPIDVSELNAGDYFFVSSNLNPNDLIAKVIRKNKSQVSYEVVHSISNPDSERIGKTSKLSFEYIRGSDSHMGGFTAKETVIALNPNDAEALINKSEQPQRIENATKISKLKSDLASATKDYAKTYATSHVNRIKSISDELYSLTGDELYNTEQAQPVNTEESRSNNAIKFSKALTPETKNLVIIHNTSIDGLEHTNKIGGMPSPSLAIANKDFPLTGFGEISLIGSKENFAPNAKNKTFNADIYSARYPRVVFLPNERVIDKFNNSFFSENALQLERYGEVISKSDLKYSRGVYDYLNDKAPVMYAYLESIGKAPDLIYEEPKPLSNIPEINKILEKYLPKAQELKNTDSALTKKFIAEVKKAYSLFRESDGKRPFDDEKMDIIATSMIDTVNDYTRTMNKPKVDIYKTKVELAKAINGDRNGYKKWIENTFSQIAKDEKIDAGETPSGNRKYIEHNIDNVLKIMKKGGTRNAENFNYGIGNVRAAVAKEYKKLAEIQKDRDKIVSGEEMKKLAEVTSGEYSRISNSIRDDFSSWGLADDYITDVATNGFRWAEREYGVTLSDEKKADITNLFALLRDYPTEYFEIKPQRIVNLHEFSGAVVPNGAEYDKAIEILKKNGITDIQRYEHGDEKARAEAVNKFSDLHFSKTRKTTSTHTKATLINALRTVMDREFGQGWFSRLLDTGKFEVMSRAEAQELETTANLDNVQGYYSAKHDKTILIAEQIAKGKDLKGLMLHEIAAHQLALGADDKAFQSILAQVEKLSESKLFAKAKAAAIEANTPAEYMNEEILAYLLEHHKGLGIVQKFIAWFKSKLRDIGKTLPALERLKWVQWASKLNEKDLVFMATSALKSASDSLMFDSVGRSGEAVKLSTSNLQSKITDAIDENWLDIVNEMKRQGVIEIKC